MATSDRYIIREYTNSTGKVWRAVIDTEADNGGLTDDQADAMVRAAMDRAERRFEQDHQNE